MAETIVVSLEVIDIAKEQGNGLMLAPHTAKDLRELPIKVAANKDAGEAVARGFFLKITVERGEPLYLLALGFLGGFSGLAKGPFFFLPASTFLSFLHGSHVTNKAMP